MPISPRGSKAFAEEASARETRAISGPMVKLEINRRQMCECEKIGNETEDVEAVVELEFDSRRLRLLNLYFFQTPTLILHD